jgi:hypothetical protein
LTFWSSVLKIFHEDLGMNKVSARWISKMLNPEQKLHRQHICQENLGAVADDEELSWKIITGDDHWTSLYMYIHIATNCN